MFLGIAIVFCTVVVGAAQLTHAASGIMDELQSNLSGDGGLQSGLGAPEGDLPTIVGKIIKAALSLLFIILVCLIIYAGWLWMSAGGDSKQVDKAKDYIKNAVIGLIVIVLAYAITDFVITKISEVAGAGGSGDGLPPPINPEEFKL
jgi:hypothetical protein